MPSGTQRLMVRDAAWLASSQEYVDWAVRALSDGYDGPALRSLAGADMDCAPRALEMGKTFRAALAELGLAFPDEAELLRSYVGELAADIVHGRTPPRVAVERIHHEVLSPFGHPRELKAWVYLAEGLNPSGDGSQLTEDMIDQTILKVATQWLRDA